MASHAQHPVFMDHDRRAPIGEKQSSRPPHQPFDAQRPVERDELADSRVVSADLHEAIQQALHLAARATLRDGLNGDPDQRARQALDAVCALARRDELRIEQLLILLKDAWRHLPEVQRASRLDADVTLARVITHCIKGFYRPSRAS